MTSWRVAISVYEQQFIFPNLMIGFGEGGCDYNLEYQIRRYDNVGSAHGFVQDLLAEGFDGCLLTTGFHTLAMEQALRGTDLPTVLVNQKAPTNAVYPGEVEAAARLTRFCVDQGHEHVLMLIYGNMEHFSAVDRLEGYLQAMEEVGLEPCVMRAGDLGERMQMREVRERLLGRGGPMAVVAYCPGLLEGMPAQCQAHGLRVGEDVLLTTFATDWTLDPHIEGLSAYIQVPLEAIGFASARMMAARLDDGRRDQPAEPVRMHLIVDGVDTDAPPSVDDGEAPPPAEDPATED